MLSPKFPGHFEYGKFYNSNVSTFFKIKFFIFFFSDNVHCLVYIYCKLHRSCHCNLIYAVACFYITIYMHYKFVVFCMLGNYLYASKHAIFQIFYRQAICFLFAFVYCILFCFLCSVIIKQLKQRMSEPKIVKRTRQCFSFNSF